MKKLFVCVLIMSTFLISCNNEKAINQFNVNYEQIKTDFKAKYKEIKSKEEYLNLKKERTAKLEKLLKENESLKGDLIDLYRTNALLDLEKYDEAINLSEKIANNSKELKSEAIVNKAYALMNKDDLKNAIEVFKTIEDKVKINNRVIEIISVFGMDSPTDELKKEYCDKFLALKEIPKEFERDTNYIYLTLAYIEKDKGNIEKAKDIIKDAIEKVKSDKSKKSLKSELENLGMIGKPAYEIKSPLWINAKKGLNLKKLKGKVVVIDFWATWCPPCRQVIPSLAKVYDELKDKGLVVIGFTKTYGHYSDENGSKGKMEREEEIKNIKEFIKRFKINYPVAVSDSSEYFKKYGVQGIPTLFYIDKKGNIADLEVGSGGKDLIKEKVLKLINK